MSGLLVVLIPALLMVTATGLERLETRLDTAGEPVGRLGREAGRDTSRAGNSAEPNISAPPLSAVEPGWPAPLYGYSPANP